MKCKKCNSEEVITEYGKFGVFDLDLISSGKGFWMIMLSLVVIFFINPYLGMALFAFSLPLVLLISALVRKITGERYRHICVECGKVWFTKKSQEIKPEIKDVCL